MRFKQGYAEELKRLTKYPYFIENYINEDEFFGRWVEWSGDELSEIKEWVKMGRARKNYKEEIKEIIDKGDEVFRKSPYDYWDELSRCLSHDYNHHLSFNDELRRYRLIEALFAKIRTIKTECEFLERHGSIIPDINIRENVFYDWRNEIWCDYTDKGI